MNLLCPTCQKQLQVPEQFAGQRMQCPLCSAQFTVPVLPQMPGAVVPPPAPPNSPAVMGQKSPASGPPSGAMLNRPAAAPSHSAAPSGIAGRAVPWIAPLSLIAIFVLMFFPWDGMFPGGIGVATQTGWQSAFGSSTIDPDWARYLSDARTKDYWSAYYGPDPKATVDALKAPGISVVLIFFILVMIPAMLAGLASVLLGMRLIPIDIPAAMAPFWPMRSLFIGGLSLAMLVFLFLAITFGLPLEQKAADQVKTTVEEMKKAAAPAESKDQARWDIEGGIRLGGFCLRTTPLFMLVLVFNIFAVAGAFLEFQQMRRATAAAPVGP